MANNPAQGITWSNAIDSSLLTNAPVSTDLTSFQMFIGLKFWNIIGGNKMLYKWALSGVNYDQIAEINGKIGDASNNYSLQLTSTSLVHIVGTAQPGIFYHHNGKQFSTYDADHDLSSANCSAIYTNTPFWYAGCWDGSIEGGGSSSTGTFYANGAFWNSSINTSSGSNGTGGGNGWLFIK